MSKDKRHNKMQAQVHREHLKSIGAVHLPPNKRHKSKKDYKRNKKFMRSFENTED